MTLTPMDIHNKQFKTKVNGYEKAEVDSFLDEIVNCYSDALDNLVDLKKENVLLTKKLNNSELRIQQTAKKISEEAAAPISSENTDLKKQYETLNNDYELLKGKVNDFMQDTKKRLQGQLDELNDNDWQYYLDKYYGRSRLYPADGSQPVLINSENKVTSKVIDNNVDDSKTPEIMDSDPTNQAQMSPDQVNNTNTVNDEGLKIIFPDDYKDHN